MKKSEAIELLKQWDLDTNQTWNGDMPTLIANMLDYMIEKKIMLPYPAEGKATGKVKNVCQWEDESGDK